jgi:hypothetical protein
MFYQVQWLTPEIPAVKEAEISISGQPEQKVSETPSQPIKPGMVAHLSS